MRSMVRTLCYSNSWQGDQSQRTHAISCTRIAATRVSKYADNFQLQSRRTQETKLLKALRMKTCMFSSFCLSFRNISWARIRWTKGVSGLQFLQMQMHIWMFFVGEFADIWGCLGFGSAAPLLLTHNETSNRWKLAGLRFGSGHVSAPGHASYKVYFAWTYPRRIYKQKMKMIEMEHRFGAVLFEQCIWSNSANQERYNKLTKSLQAKPHLAVSV